MIGGMVGIFREPLNRPFSSSCAWTTCPNCSGSGTVHRDEHRKNRNGELVRDEYDMTCRTCDGAKVVPVTDSQ